MVFKELSLLPLFLGILFLVIAWKKIKNLKSKRRISLGVSSLALFKRNKSLWRYLPETLFIVGIFFIIIVLLDPVLPLIKNKKKIEAKGIMIVLDFSESMTHEWKKLEIDYTKTEEEKDLTKLDIERKYVIKFIESRKNDLVGLIVYSDNAYIVSPLTQDHQNLIALLQLFRIHPQGRDWYDTIIPGEIYTATGEALFLANGHLVKYGRVKEKIISLFTDGETNTGRKPKEALKEIKKSGFKVFVLGVDYGSFGDAAELLAKDVKEITKGGFFPIDTEEDFKKAVNFIDKWTGKNTISVDEYIVNQPQYFYFALCALIALILAFVLKNLPFFRDLL